MKRIASVAAVFAGATMAITTALPSTPTRVLAAECTLCAGGEYHPVTPTRVFDSRHNAVTPDGINDVAPLGRKVSSSVPATSSFNVSLLDLPSTDPSEDPLEGLTGADVLAVVVSITVVNPTQRGWLAAYPAGETPSTPSSILNFLPGNVIPNLSVVRPGVDGKLTIRIFSGTTGSADVLIDVLGWFSTSAFTNGTPDDLTDERGSRLIPVAPGRILDTRTSSGPIPPGSEIALQVVGADTITAPFVTDIVPADPVPDLDPLSRDVVGVLINVVGVRPTAQTYVAVVPEAPEGLPTTSNLNLTPGLVKANLVVVPVGADGKIHIYNHAGSTNVVVDVMGYFIKVPDDTRAGRVIPLTAPFRAFDTRLPQFGSVPLGPGQAEVWSFANFAASVTVGGVSVGNQSAFLGNITNAELGRQYPSVGVTGFLTLYPADGSAKPGISNLNVREGIAVPNMALVKYGTDQQVNVYNHAGYSHYLMDVSAVVLAD